jgi:hypothetical protein
MQLLYTSSADQANQNHDDSDNQQDVDEATNGIGSDQAEQPQDQQYDSDCIEHDFVLSGCYDDSDVVEPSMLTSHL